MVGRILLFLALAGLLSSSIYLLLALIATLRFRFAPPELAPAPDRGMPPPRVSVLKPLHGMEPLLEQRLESFFRQEYPIFELIFGARSGSDLALEVVEALRQKHPGIRTRVVICG